MNVTKEPKSSECLIRDLMVVACGNKYVSVTSELNVHLQDLSSETAIYIDFILLGMDESTAISTPP